MEPSLIYVALSILFIIYIIGCNQTAIIAGKQGQSTTVTFFMSFFFTPITGLLMVIASREVTKDNIQYKEVLINEEPIDIPEVASYLDGKIQFLDGIKTEISKDSNSEKYSIWDGNRHVYYTNKEKAIKASYIFAKKGTVINDNLA